MRQIKKLSIFLLVFFSGCFDYQEKIIFAPDFSGVVEISYTVPVYKETGNSMLKFLPSSESEVKEKYGIYLSAGSFTLKDFTSKTTTAGDDDPFPDRVEVSYRVLFKEAQVLEHILMGETDVFRRGGYLFIRRKFPASPPLDENSPTFTRNFHERIVQSFAKHFLSFNIVFPWYYDLVTNYGSFTKPGVHSFQLPLQSTFKSVSGFTWKIELKANRPPEGEL